MRWRSILMTLLVMEVYVEARMGGFHRMASVRTPPRRAMPRPPPVHVAPPPKIPIRRTTLALPLFALPPLLSSFLENLGTGTHGTPFNAGYETRVTSSSLSLPSTAQNRMDVIAPLATPSTDYEMASKPPTPKMTMDNLVTTEIPTDFAKTHPHALPTSASSQSITEKTAYSRDASIRHSSPVASLLTDSYGNSTLQADSEWTKSVAPRPTARASSDSDLKNAALLEMATGGSVQEEERQQSLRKRIVALIVGAVAISVGVPVWSLLWKWASSTFCAILAHTAVWDVIANHRSFSMAVHNTCLGVFAHPHTWPAATRLFAPKMLHTWLVYSSGAIGLSFSILESLNIRRVLRGEGDNTFPETGFWSKRAMFTPVYFIPPVVVSIVFALTPAEPAVTWSNLGSFSTPGGVAQVMAVLYAVMGFVAGDIADRATRRYLADPAAQAALHARMAETTEQRRKWLEEIDRSTLLSPWTSVLQALNLILAILNFDCQTMPVAAITFAFAALGGFGSGAQAVHSINLLPRAWAWARERLAGHRNDDGRPREPAELEMQ